MAKAILVIGESGMGKSTAIKNLDPKTTYVINVVGKDLPFKGWKSMYIPTKDEEQGNIATLYDHTKITACLLKINEKLTYIKTVIVDDFQYVMFAEWMRRLKERGFDVFQDLSKHMWDIVWLVKDLRPDLTIIFTAHCDDDGKMKTVGKLFREKLSPEGLFTVVLVSERKEVKEELLNTIL